MKPILFPVSFLVFVLLGSLGCESTSSQSQARNSGSNRLLGTPPKSTVVKMSGPWGAKVRVRALLENGRVHDVATMLNGSMEDAVEVYREFVYGIEMERLDGRGEFSVEIHEEEELVWSGSLEESRVYLILNRSKSSWGIGKAP